MENNQKNSRLMSLKVLNKDKQLVLHFIQKQVEKGTGCSLSTLRMNYNEEALFAIALKHVTTTKKALCTALSIPVEAGCRYKRKLEKHNLLVQSIDKIYCPFTKHKAHRLSTNPGEFMRLLKSNTTQLNLFE